jgi:hypothetical protein
VTCTNDKFRPRIARAFTELIRACTSSNRQIFGVSRINSKRDVSNNFYKDRETFQKCKSFWGVLQESRLCALLWDISEKMTIPQAFEKLYTSDLLKKIENPQTVARCMHPFLIIIRLRF